MKSIKFVCTSSSLLIQIHKAHQYYAQPHLITWVLNTVAIYNNYNLPMTWSR